MVSLVSPTHSLKGKPHYRRTEQVYLLLNQAPSESTYDRLIEYVRQSTGKGCSRKLISKWKKTVNNEQLPVTSKLSKNRQDKASNSNINVLPIVISSDQNSIDLTTAELNPEINQIESEAIPTLELLESEANLSIIGDEDKPEGKPEIVHQTSLTIEEEFNDSKRSPKVRLRRSLTDNGKNDSLLINDNDLPSIRDNEKTGHCSLVTGNCKAWSYVAATAIVVGIAGCGWVLSKNNSQPVIAQTTSIQNSEFKVQNASPDNELSTIQNPKSKIQNQRVQNGLPRTIKINLTLTSPQDLKVKPGDEVISGTVLSDRSTERQRLLAQKKQLEISLKKLNLPIPEITQPKPIPALSKLPPVSYQQEEANIALKQQELAEAEKAIANQETKIKELQAIQNVSPDSQSRLIQSTKSNISQISLPQKIQGNTEQHSQNKEQTDRKYLPFPIQQSSINSNSIQNPKSKIQNQQSANRSLINVIEHEKVVLSQLIAARDKAKLQLDIAKSKLITAKEQRAHIEYQRYLEETKRAIALQQQQIELERQRSIRAGQLQEREYSKAQIETKIQEVDNAIAQLSTVKAPYPGKIKKVKWTGQSDHNLTVTITLDVDDGSEKPTVISQQ